MNREEMSHLAGEAMKLATDLEDLSMRLLALRKKINKAYFDIDDALDLESFSQNPNINDGD